MNFPNTETVSVPSLPKLFCKTFVISACTFGGGFVIAGLMKKEFVDRLHWLEEEEMLDYVAIAQSCPGAIAVNAATFVGIRVAGIPGALIATFGCVAPAMILVTAMGLIYRRYHKLNGMQTILSTMRPAVAAMIASAFVSLFLNAVSFAVADTGIQVDWVSVALFVLAVIAIRSKKIPGIAVMFSCGVLYMLYFLIF